MREHLLVTPHADGWSLPGLFVARGDAGFLRRLLLAFGLLHRYSDLPWWLGQLPPPPAPTLDALAAHWWRPR
jgi:hygromycin-B 7''-O-kinase